MFWRQTLVSISPGLGTAVVILSITSELEKGAEAASAVQSLCLLCSGVAIFALGTLVRQLAAQLDTLEKEISKLKWARDQARLDKVLPSIF